MLNYVPSDDRAKKILSSPYFYLFIFFFLILGLEESIGYDLFRFKVRFDIHWFMLELIQAWMRRSVWENQYSPLSFSLVTTYKPRYRERKNGLGEGKIFARGKNSTIAMQCQTYMWLRTTEISQIFLSWCAGKNSPNDVSNKSTANAKS